MLQNLGWLTLVAALMKTKSDSKIHQYKGVAQHVAVLTRNVSDTLCGGTIIYLWYYICKFKKKYSVFLARIFASNVSS